MGDECAIGIGKSQLVQLVDESSIGRGTGVRTRDLTIIIRRIRRREGVGADLSQDHILEPAALLDRHGINARCPCRRYSGHGGCERCQRGGSEEGGDGEVHCFD